MAQGPLSPVVKYAGGKSWLVPEMRQRYLSVWQDRTWVEPFAGGMALALGLPVYRAVINDVNPHLINLYRWIVQGMGEPPIALENDAATYYAHRQRFNELIAAGEATGREAAWLIYYLNRTGYNGLMRFNRAGEYNVPFGRYKQIQYRRIFADLQSRLARWRFAAGDFSDLEVEPGACIYADPPYDVPFRQYAPGGFSWEDQVRLVEWLDGHDGPVWLSNAATPRVLELYTRYGYTVRELAAPRRISCSGDRTPAAEVLAERNIVRRPFCCGPRGVIGGHYLEATP